MGERFYCTIMCLTDRQQISAKLIYSLVVRGINKCAASVQLVKEIRAAASNMIYIMIHVFAVPLMCGCIFDMLADCAAEMNIDDLKTLADTQNGFTPFDKKIQYLKLDNIELCIDCSGTVVMLPKECGRNIAAARQQQAVTVYTLFRIKRRKGVCSQ